MSSRVPPRRRIRRTVWISEAKRAPRGRAGAIVKWRATRWTRGPVHRNELWFTPDSESIHPFEVRRQPLGIERLTLIRPLLERGMVGGVVFPYRFRAQKRGE